MKTKLIALTMMLVAALAARADVIATFPEVNHEGSSPYPSPVLVVGTEVYGPIVASSATLSGVFGMTSIYYGSTANFELYINDFLVGSTYDVSPDPYFNVVPFSFALSGAALNSLNSGSATLSLVQTTDVVIRLSETELKIQTASAVPEGGSSIAMFTLVLCGLVALRRKC